MLFIYENKIMVSVRAIYDGKELRLLEKVEVKLPQEVIVVFLGSEVIAQDEINGHEIGQLSLDSGALDFLHDEAEDIYSDENLKVRYD
jgi:hypothetical protein